MFAVHEALVSQHFGEHVIQHLDSHHLSLLSQLCEVYMLRPGITVLIRSRGDVDHVDDDRDGVS